MHTAAQHAARPSLEHEGAGVGGESGAQAVTEGAAGRSRRGIPAQRLQDRRAQHAQLLPHRVRQPLPLPWQQRIPPELRVCLHITAQSMAQHAQHSMQTEIVCERLL